MQFLYKYTQIREDFFKEPMFRVTPFSELNDPFEGAVTLEHIKKENEFLNEHYGKDKNHNEYLIEEFYGITQEELSDYGILSLTEDPLNPIMWSHYGDEHKGIVIQLKTDTSFLLGANEFDNNIKFKEDVFGYFSDIPKAIKYSRYRELFLFPDEVIPKKKYHYPHKKLSEHIVYTKANEWMYEKEHRSVLELKNADVIICDKSEELYSFCKKYKEIQIKEKNEKYEISYPLNYELHEDMGDESIRFEIYLIVKYLNPLYFYKINPKSIIRVIFGCRSDESKVNRIRTILNDNIELNCELFKTNTMMDRYELSLQKI